MQYEVLKPFGGNSVGDVLVMNVRQAQHWLLAEFVKPYQPPKKAADGKTK